MPHAELKYSADLAIDPADILSAIEQTILRHSPEAGACKGRAYPATVFHHTHFLASISMLAKPGRDAAFIAAVTRDLEFEIKKRISQRCYFSLDVGFTGQIYVTNEHDPAGP